MSTPTTENDTWSDAIAAPAEQAWQATVTAGQIFEGPYHAFIQGHISATIDGNAALRERLGVVEGALDRRSKDVHLLAHQGEAHRHKLDESGWQACVLDPCVSDRAALEAPRV